MSDRSTISRRAWLKGLGAVAGAAVGTRLGGRGLVEEALAAPAGPKAAVVSIFFEGGFNACFSSADSLRGKFGVTDRNIFPVKDPQTGKESGLVIDGPTFGTLSPWALQHMAAIGNRHGSTDHPTAQKNNFTDGKATYPVQLAAAMGGDAAFKAVALGTLPIAGASDSQGGVSLQLLRTMGDVSTALGIGPVDFNRPARTAASKALSRSRAMSQNTLIKNPKSASFAKDGYDTVVDSLGKPPLTLDVAAVAQAYGAGGGSLDSLASRLAAAELMIRSGTNVVSISDTGWDTHGDSTGGVVRTKMQDDVMPALRIFIDRLQSQADLAAMNISVMLHGDFARSLPTSDHAPALSALVIGSRVKVGTTGRVSERVTLPDGTGGSKEMWGYLAALAGVQTADSPFGGNIHPLVR